MNTTRRDMIEQVAEQTGYTQEKCREVFESLLDVITQSLNEGDTIELRGHWTLFRKWRMPRPALNPRTGKRVYVKAHKTAVCRFAKPFIEGVCKMRKGNLPAV